MNDERVMKISGVKRLYNLTAKETALIKRELTFDNPKYKQAVQYAKNPNWIKIPPKISYYVSDIDIETGDRYLEVPIGYRPLLSAAPTIEDERVLNEVEYPEFMLDLRDTQDLALNHYITANKKSVNGLIVLPTGKGKSILGLAIAHKLKQKTLIIVHKDDLVVGWKSDIEICFNKKVTTGLIKAQSRKVGNQITIATIQTLNRFNSDELKKLQNEFGLVILDEAHHCPASSYDCLMNFNAFYRLGLTATPERNDGTKYLMHLHFGDVCFDYKDHTPKEENDILPVEVIHKKVMQYCNPLLIEKRGTFMLSPKKVTYTNAKYVLQDNEYRYSTIPYECRPRITNRLIEDCLLENENVQDLICADIYTEFKNNSKIIAFFTQKKHIELYYDLLVNKFNIKPDYIQCYYGDSKLTSKEAIQNAESGKVRITLSTYAKGTEGTNIKSLDTEFLISSLNNEKSTEQAVGRIRRVADNKRSIAKVYDYDFSNAVILSSHFNTRLKRYTKLGFKVISSI